VHDDLKEQVRAHWEGDVCGARYTGGETDPGSAFRKIDEGRYEQDYMLLDFAKFPEGRGKKVLEVGLGTGSDFANWVRSGAEAHGRDLTNASVELVRERLQLEGLEADVQVGDAEHLDFADESFDIYYSWGVLHHTPNTEQAVSEAYRVLKPGGTMRIMLYHYPSVGVALAWLANGILRFRFASPRSIYGSHVESPGTKSYTVGEARDMVGRYFGGSQIAIRTYLGSGDLLTQQMSSRYSGRGWRVVQAVYPRWFVRRVLGHRFGTVMTIEVTKPVGS